MQEIFNYALMQVKLLFILRIFDAASIVMTKSPGLVSGFCSQACQTREQVARFEPLLARFIATCSLFMHKTLYFSQCLSPQMYKLNAGGPYNAGLAPNS